MNQSNDDDENVTYIEPNIEFELPKEKRQECRNILMEIKNFGVSQRQTLFLIRLLAMELENGEVMRAIVKSVGEQRKNVPVGPKIALPEGVEVAGKSIKKKLDRG